jgi:hypothetical protein
MMGTSFPLSTMAGIFNDPKSRTADGSAAPPLPT